MQYRGGQIHFWPLAGLGMGTVYPSTTSDDYAGIPSADMLEQEAELVLCPTRVSSTADYHRLLGLGSREWFVSNGVSATTNIIGSGSGAVAATSQDAPSALPLWADYSNHTGVLLRFQGNGSAQSFSVKYLCVAEYYCQAHEHLSRPVVLVDGAEKAHQAISSYVGEPGGNRSHHTFWEKAGGFINGLTNVVGSVTGLIQGFRSAKGALSGPFIEEVESLPLLLGA